MLVFDFICQRKQKTYWIEFELKQMQNNSAKHAKNLKILSFFIEKYFRYQQTLLLATQKS